MDATDAVMTEYMGIKGVKMPRFTVKQTSL